MTKQQMFEIVARKAHLTKKASREAIDAFLNEIRKELSKGEESKVVLSGFGTFHTVKVKDKPVIIPGTKIRQIVKSHLAARFTPGKTLKKSVK